MLTTVMEFLRGASGRNKHPPAFILQKTVGTELFFSSSMFFREVERWRWRWVGGVLNRGGSGLGPE